MNYLAHSHLSYKDGYLLVGNYIADMVTNKEIARLPPYYLRGIDLHRHIDTFTDQHSAVRAATALLRPSQGKYAPVVVDVLYDYLLAESWQHYCTESIRSVIQQTYDHLLAAKETLPSRIHPKLDGMIRNDALMGYTTIEGIDKTMTFLAKRAKFDNSFGLATRDLQANYTQLVEGFSRFYPELVKSCSDFLSMYQVH